MKKTITKFAAAVGLLAAGILGLSNAENASATDIELRISPTRFDYELKPGETVSGEFTVKNLGDYDIDYEVIASPYFTESDEKGNVKYRYDIENTYTEIAKWVTFDKDSGELGADGSAIVHFTITVPQDAPGGGQYTALLASTRGKKSDGSEDDSGNVTINELASLGPVVYAKIDGETRETADILKNETNGFLFNPPITASSTVKNTGNVHTEASYIMRVFPFFGGESLYNNEDNPIKVTVLPGATRYYDLSWTADQGAPSIGIYKVESEVRIFDEVSKIERTVIICPMWVLILIVVFIVAVIFWLVARAKSRKQ